MNRRFVVAAALLMAVLSVSVAPVSAADSGLVVVSQHTTDADFSNATALQNMVVADGSVDYQPHATFGFESGVPSGWYLGSGSSITSEDAKTGSSSLSFDNTNIGLAWYRESYSDVTVSAAIHPSIYDNRVGVALGLQGYETSYVAYIDEGSGELVIKLIDNFPTSSTLNSASVPGGVDRSSWYHIEFERVGDQFTARLYDDDPAAGGSLIQTVTASDSTYGSGYVGGYAAAVGAAYVDDLKVVDPTADTSGRYVSANHSVGNAAQATVNITELSDVSAAIAAEYYDGESWVEATSTTVSSAGNYTLDLPSVDSSTWRITAEVTKSGSGYAFEIADDSVLWQPRAPTVDESSASPSGGGTLSEANLNVSIDVTDSDFPTPQGDSVNATLYGDGDVIGSDTLTSDGTANVSWTPTGGAHSYYWRIEDSYGHVVTTQNYSFSLPSTLYIRNETSPDSLIDGDATVTVTFFGNEDVVERTTTDGSLDLAGLPVNDRFVAVVEADGYEPRRIVIDSLIEQQTAYLLADSAESARIVFSLDDSTGRFQQADLFIEKAITQGETTAYRTIAADSFGAAGEFAVTLHNDQRYRLRARNEQGETRVLGSYTTAGNAAAVLPIGQIALNTNTEQADVFKAELVEEGGQRAVRIGYRNPDETADSLTIEVVNASDPNDVIRANTTETGPFGTYIETIPLPAGTQQQVEYDVKYQIEYRDGTESGGTEVVGSMSEWFGPSWAIDDQLLSLMAWVGILALTGLVVIFSPRAAAMVAPIVATAFVWMGAIDIPLPILALAGGAALIFQIGGDR